MLYAWAPDCQLVQHATDFARCTLQLSLMDQWLSEVLLSSLDWACVSILGS
jgi:hypothetical protein